MITTTFKNQFQTFLTINNQTAEFVSNEIKKHGGKTTSKTIRWWLYGKSQINEKTIDELQKHMARYGWKVKLVKK